MKRLVILIPLLFILCFWHPSLITQATVFEEANLIENNMSLLRRLYPTSHGQIECYEKTIKYWYDSSEISWEGEYGTHLEDGEYLYIIIKGEAQKLYKLRKGVIQKEVELGKELTINQIMLLNDYLYLVGDNEETGLIITYNLDLREVKQYTYGEGCHLKIKQVYLENNNWYLACSKDAHASEPFASVGSFGEEKTCLIKLNNKMQISDILYFNHQKVKEVPKHLVKNSTGLYLVIQSGETYEAYKIDQQFVSLYLGHIDQASDVLIGVDGSILKIDESSGFTLSRGEANLIEKAWNQVVYYDISGGYFNVYVIENGNLMKYQFDEYHVDQLANFHVDYFQSNLSFDQNINHQGVVEINSIVDQIEVVTEKEVILNIPGTFDVPLLIKRPNKNNIKIASRVTIDPYVNVTSGGIYRTGVMLAFMGNATLNGNVVTSGYYINSPGNYTLVISDNKTQLQVISFSVVDDYYCRTMNLSAGDYTMQAGSETYLDFTMPDAYKIDEVIMDQVSVSFMLNSNILKVSVTSLNNYGVASHTINKVRIGEVWYDVNLTFTVMTLKKAPLFEVIEGETKLPSFTIKIDDPEQAIKGITFTDLATLKEVTNYLKNGEVTLDGLKGKKGTIEVNILYDLGDGIVKSKRLITIDATFKSDAIFQASYKMVGERIDEAHLSLTDAATKSITNVVVCNENISASYLTNHSNRNLIISIALTGFVVMVIIALLILRKKKRSKI